MSEDPINYQYTLFPPVSAPIETPPVAEATEGPLISRTGFVLQTYAGDSWCITGWPTPDYTFRSYSSAYDVEDFLQQRLPNPVAVFDSESSQLFVIFKNRADAAAYLARIEEHLVKIKELA